MSDKIFGGSFALGAKALDVRSARQGLIQSNIANLETPGYKVQELPFAKVMEGVMSGQDELTRTHARHLKIGDVERGNNLRISEQNRPVDLDEEMVKLSGNQLMYEVTTRIIAKKLEGLRYAIDEGGK
ncbi:MAG: flagellar basal body rod protein FlgB [Proteobacteria bacterium]|nr:flagellar basal body rod protein FlgB [Pseudomonadota bacterium]MBU1714597.1 flagellar basal body rod protein FlgB [Pseudomonadota bacterium]